MRLCRYVHVHIYISSNLSADQVAKGAQYVPEYHGFTGPVQVTYPVGMYGGPQQKAFMSSFNALTGISISKGMLYILIHCVSQIGADVNGGSSNCVSITPLSINRNDSFHRSSSAQAYLTPVETVRVNWVTLTGHQVTKIIWSKTTVPMIASGVQFGPSNGSSIRYTANARREVIISAGAIQSPALLQLSGIGDSNTLRPLGINTLVDLKTVGKNLQMQIINRLGASGTNFDKGGTGPSNAIAYPNIYQVYLLMLKLMLKLINDIRSLGVPEARRRPSFSLSYQPIRRRKLAMAYPRLH